MVYPCFFDCQEPGDSKKRKLYMEAESGFYHCFVCGASGGSYTLQQHFGDTPSKDSTDDPYTRRRILDAATDVGVTILHNNDDVLLYLLNERGLTSETIEHFKLGFIAPPWSLVGVLPEGVTAEQVLSTGLVHKDGPRAGKDFFYRHILIPFRSRGHTITMRARAWGETKGGKYLSGAGEDARLFNQDDLDDAEEAIFIEGEFDTMALRQCLKASPERRLQRMAVVGFSGVNAMPDDFDDRTAHLKRAFIGFDSDGPGRKAAEKLAEHIGARARILELPYEDDRKCDWSEYLLSEPSHGTDLNYWRSVHPYAGHDWRDVYRLISQASGKRVYSIAEAGEAYRTFRRQNRGLRLGYGELDAILKPGLLPGQVMVVLAKTGAGKTVFLCNLAYNMAIDGKHVLFVSLEMTREEIYDRLLRIYLFWNPRHSPQQAEQALANVYICDENRLGEKELNALIAEFQVEAGVKPDALFIDYLQYYARGARGNTPYEKASNAIMQLKAEAKLGRYVVITPSQVSRFSKEGKRIDLDAARDSGAVEETADFLFALWRPDDAAVDDDSALKDERPPSGAVNITTLKSRHGGKGKEVRLLMDVLCLSIVPFLHTQAGRVRKHNQNVLLTYEQLREIESAPIQDSFAELEDVS